MKKMYESIRRFLKKYRVFVIIVVIILLVVSILLLFFRSVESELEEEPKEQSNYEAYEIRMPDEIVEKIDDFYGRYDVFSVQEINHFTWAQNFVKGLQRRFEYTEKPHPAIPGHPFHTKDQTIHYWLNGDDFITYNVANDFLSFEFATPVSIANMTISIDSIENAQKSLLELDSRFFSGDFNYVVNEIVQIDGDYMIKYTRMLGGVPIYTYLQDTYLLVSPEGRLKGGLLVLTEFEKLDETVTLSGEKLKENMEKTDYTKVVDFDFVDAKLREDYEYISKQERFGEIDLKTVKLAYFYTSKFQEVLEPYFIFDGLGIVEIDGEIHEAQFYVRTK